jgi:hypothetical protein
MQHPWSMLSRMDGPEDRTEPQRVSGCARSFRVVRMTTVDRAWPGSRGRSMASMLRLESPEINK